MAYSKQTESIRESKRAWHRKNYEKSRSITKAWLARNPGAVAKRNIEYKFAVKQRTPAWANLDAINAIYLQAQANGLTVDHIYPLRGETVSGLHVENNLRLISHSENASKKNKHPGEVA